MTDPKPSTNDILAKIRAKAAAPPAESAATPVEPLAAAEAPAVDAGVSAPATAPAEPAVVPKSTADILAAARAKAAVKPVAAPKGTADIPASVKAQGGAPLVVPAAAAAAPKSPAEIMAAIRAKAGAVPAAAVPKAETQDAGIKSKSLDPAGTKLPVAAVGLSAAEMIKAARSAESGTVAAAPGIALPSKPLPGKLPTAAAPKATVTAVPRRSALEDIVAMICSPVVVAWTSFSATMLVSTLATARFMMPNVLVEPPTRFKIGPPNDYAPGTVSTKWQAQFNIWVVNGEIDGAQIIYALSTVCTHLGCTPNWLEGEQKFKCPCHGSGFYKTGVNFEGPAPRPLERVGIRLAEDGMLEVDKSVKFQKELGQWINAASFVGVG